ncbi:MAG: DUF5058 family protein [Zestosphaera sp.]
MSVEDYLSIANNSIMWLAVIPMVVLVFIQAFLFARRALKTGRELGLSDKQLKAAFRSGAISSVGPSFAILVGMIVLLAAMGAPYAWLRLSIIGSISYELMAAEFAAQAMGASLSKGMNAMAFANAIFVAGIGCTGWLIITGLFTPQLEKLRLKLAGGRAELLPIITVTASVGAFSKLVGDYAIRLDETTAATIFGGITMGTVLTIAEKKNLQWLREWSLAISMFAGMLVAMLLRAARGG